MAADRGDGRMRSRDRSRRDSVREMTGKPERSAVRKDHKKRDWPVRDKEERLRNERQSVYFHPVLNPTGKAPGSHVKIGALLSATALAEITLPDEFHVEDCELDVVYESAPQISVENTSLVPRRLAG